MQAPGLTEAAGERRGMRRDVVTVVVIYFAVTVGFSVTFAITDVASSLPDHGGEALGCAEPACALCDARGSHCACVCAARYKGPSSLLLSLKHYFWNSLNAFAGGGLDEEDDKWQVPSVPSLRFRQQIALSPLALTREMEALTLETAAFGPKDQPGHALDHR